MFGWRKEKRHKRHEHKATRKEEKKKACGAEKWPKTLRKPDALSIVNWGSFLLMSAQSVPPTEKRKRCPKKKKKAKKESELVGTGNSHFHLHLFCCFCFVVRAELFFLLGGGCCCFFFVVVAAVAAVAAVLVVVVSLLKER